MPTPPLNLANIEKAAQVVDPAFLRIPQYEDGTLNAALGQRVLVKVETANPIRSFKGRGADFFARSLDPNNGSCAPPPATSDKPWPTLAAASGSPFKYSLPMT